MSIRAEIDLSCVCGATWQEALLFDDVEGETVTEIDLTGWDAILSIDRGDRILEYTVASGHLQIDGPAGTVSLTVQPETTIRYPNGGEMPFEMRLIEPTGAVRSYVSGTVNVLETVRP